MSTVTELQQEIVEALRDGERKSKPQLAKQIGDVDGAHLATALRSLKREGRIIVGSDGSKRVFGLAPSQHG